MSDQVHDTPAERRWRPLNRTDRRVIGVLIEKAKTTPDAYPMSLNGLTTGCNQKNNRDPQMTLDAADVEESIARLRESGALAEVHSEGRVPKYRHYMKEWLGVDGTELAVMAELLLRGPQTVGELRGRAARMAAQELPDLGALKPVLRSLLQKQLIVEFSPEGRGQIVSHSLFSDDEQRRLRQHFAAAAAAAAQDTEAATSRPATAKSAGADDLMDEIRRELAALREEMDQLRQEVSQLQGKGTVA